MEIMSVDDLCYKIIGAAMAVHSHFCPGFLEEVYKNALAVNPVTSPRSDNPVNPVNANHSNSV